MSELSVNTGRLIPISGPNSLFLVSDLRQSQRAVRVFEALQQALRSFPDASVEIDPGLARFASPETSLVDMDEIRSRHAASIAELPEDTDALMFVGNRFRKLDSTLCAVIGEVAGRSAVEQVFYLGNERTIREYNGDSSKITIIDNPLQAYEWARDISPAGVSEEAVR